MKQQVKRNVAPQAELTKKLTMQTAHTAEVDRAFGVVAQAWENPNISVDEMCEHLDAIGEIISGKSAFAEFTESTGLAALRG